MSQPVQKQHHQYSELRDQSEEIKPEGRQSDKNQEDQDEKQESSDLSHPSEAQPQSPSKQKKSSQVEKVEKEDGPRTKLEVRCQKYLTENNPKDRLLCNMPAYFSNPRLRKQLTRHFYNTHSTIPRDDPDRLHFVEILQAMKEKKDFRASLLNLSQKESRGTAAVMGMAICDALGASTEFAYFQRKGLGIVKHGFADIKNAIKNKILHARSGQQTIWTDDASMGFCMADSLLLNDYDFNPLHLRYMFVMWLQHGLNNGGRGFSIGLGGNISISMYEFMEQQEDYTEKGDQFNNGNGSLMRLAPFPVAFREDLEQAIQYSGLQSLTTHNGVEAQQCCKLMANIIVQLINRKPTQPPKQVILRVCDSFRSPVQSVVFLARGEQEPQQFYEHCCRTQKKYRVFNRSLADRKWNWREPSFTYSPHRTKDQPGYIGSYCMDALAMALHIVMMTDTFRSAAVMGADMGGDCDTVGAIAGQIAGAMYGVGDDMMSLYSQMDDFTKGRYDAFLKSYKMAVKKTIP